MASIKLVNLREEFGADAAIGESTLWLKMVEGYGDRDGPPRSSGTFADWHKLVFGSGAGAATA